MCSPFVRQLPYHLYIGPRNTRPAASESAIGGLQIPPARAYVNEAPTFGTDAETPEECEKQAGTIPPERNSC